MSVELNRRERLHCGPVTGFSLVELMVTVAVLAVLLAMAAPTFNQTILSYRLSSFANDLVGSTLLARSEAIKRNTVVTLCVSIDGSTCGAGTGGWEQGWIVRSGADVLQQRQALPTGIRMSSATTTVNFQPTGLGATQATVTVCRATPNVGNEERVVTINATGRAAVTKTTSGICP
jgi:type IV fimbrial biogenesis protein FimT